MAKYLYKFIDVSEFIEKNLNDSQKADMMEYLLTLAGGKNGIIKNMNMGCLANYPSPAEQSIFIKDMYYSSDDEGKVLLLEKLASADDCRMLNDYLIILIDYINNNANYGKNILNVTWSFFVLS